LVLLLGINREYAEDYLGLLQGESRDFVVGDLKSLFSAIGIRFEIETETIQRLVERQIWDELCERAEATSGGQSSIHQRRTHL
jgi:hypothetical protein